METDVTLERGVVVVAVSGRIDFAVAAEFEARLRPFLNVAEIRGLILDIADVTYVSSGGLRVMLMASRALTRRSAGFAVCSPSEPIHGLLEGTGFAEVLNVHDNRESALAAFGPDEAT
ncbi:MAG: STAS domain-containing protein [Gammaproteobacteria bacterium]|nr:STAS domain-containing protein [Gammaproteobacteria bacterium]